VKVLADGQTDRQTDRHTHRQTQTDFIICPMLYAIAMGQMIKLFNKLHILGAWQNDRA